MGFRGTLWRPDADTRAAIRRGQDKVARKTVTTEKQARERAKKQPVVPGPRMTEVESATLAELIGSQDQDIV